MSFPNILERNSARISTIILPIMRETNLMFSFLFFQTWLFIPFAFPITNTSCKINHK